MVILIPLRPIKNRSEPLALSMKIKSRKLKPRKLKSRFYVLALALVTSVSSAQQIDQLAYAQSVANSDFALAMQAVIEYNPSIKGKLAELEAQGYAIDVSRAARYPSFSVAANNSNEEFGDQGTASLSLPIYGFGKFSTDINQAKATYDAEEWDLLRVQRQLLEEAAVAYVNINGIQQRLQVADLNIAEHDTLYQRIERREQGQLASEADVLLARSRLIQAEAQKQRIVGEYGVAVAELRAITIAEVRINQPVSPSLLNSQSELALQEAALNNSAEIGFQRKQYEAAEYSVKSEQLASLPTLYARAEHDFLDQRINQDTTRMGLVLEANLDGFGFATRGRIRGATARLDAAEQQINVTTQEIRREVSVLVANRDTQRNLIQSQQNAIDAVEQTLESFIRQYETGRKSWVEVLNTQRDLTNLRFDMAQFETDLMVLSLRIQSLIGGLDEIAGVFIP